MMRREIIGSIWILTVLLAVKPAISQEGEWAAETSHQVTREDSIALLGAARADQAGFERYRRHYLPPTWGGGSSRCDERVGRFCLNHMAGQSAWVAPREREDVTEARNELIHALGLVIEYLPGDRWINGQRVRYLVEARRFEEALATAGQCRAERWWCSSLAGFAYHYAARPAEADSAYVAALASMDDERRGRWTDLSLILDEQTVRVYRRLADEERAGFEERFWRIADPLLIRPGNEILAEHYSRHVWAELQERAEAPEGVSWGWDLRELLIRYGWPHGWEQTRNFGITTMDRPPVVSHYSSSPRRLLPPADALLDETATSGIWDIDEQRSRTGYNIPIPDSIARWFAPLAHQVAVFRRGETAVIAAAFELPADSVPESVAVEAGLTLLPTSDPGLEPMLSAAISRGNQGWMSIEAPATPMLVGVEVLVPSEKRIARARYGLDLSPIPRDLLALSDLLLLRGDTELPDSLESAIVLARGSTRVVPGERIGIYWETYGLDPVTTPTLTMQLRLLRPRSGWLRRLGERAGLLRDSDAIRLRWEEPVLAGPLLARSIHIEIPHVPAGEYAIELAVEAPGREPLTVQREIEVGGF